MKKKHGIFHNILLYSVFLLYVAVLLTLLFMKRHSFRSYNFIPFHSIMDYLFNDNIIVRSFAFSNLIGNVILFVPLGGYITLFNSDKGLRKNLLWVFIFSVSAEIIQYALMVGVADVDDVILNCLGGFIGIIVYRFLLVIFKDHKKVRYAIEIIAPAVGILFFLTIFLYN